MNPFEPFQPVRSSDSGRGVPTLRILSGGRLVLNAAGVRLLAGVEHVRLLWDADTKRIGIAPASESSADTFKVSRAASQATITSKEFVDHYVLPHGQRMRLELDGDIYVASTETPAQPSA